ncbi:MAG: guanylate kinase [Proteobacteria bacterium]|nr:guanylate kinase [Pseudomonadota bacterium]
MLGTLFIISAPSGGGKTSLVAALLEKLSHVKVSVSHTTRAPRMGEVDGVNYFFVSEAQFKKYQQNDYFLESANVFNNFYGTSKEWVLKELEAGRDVILEIDWQGANHVKAQMECVSIFIVPPSKEALLERLMARKQDSDEVIASRMSKASAEISHCHEYDYLVVNDNFELALEDLVNIFKAQRLRTARQKIRYKDLLETFN